MDHFTHNIIRNELRALTATPAPNPMLWAFSPENDQVFADDSGDRVTPKEWLARGLDTIQTTLANAAPSSSADETY
jgi:putative membrane protein